MTSSEPFKPTHHAFAFTNSWPSEPAVCLQTPFGAVNLGDAKNGLCGGMVYAALDYWYSGGKPPGERPAAGTALYKFLVRRIVDSWNIPVGVAQYYSWMNLPDTDTSFDLFGKHVVVDRGVIGRTIGQQWPQIKSDLDRGVPSPLGVVTVRSGQLGDLGQNHQVLAYSYAEGAAEPGAGRSATAVTLAVYDPNRGADDGTFIRFDPNSPTAAALFTHNLALDKPVRGFFRSSYAPESPPSQPAGLHPLASTNDRIAP